MSTAYSGVNANVLSGTLDVDAQGWSADVTVNTFDSTTTADLGWDDETSATSRVEGSFDFFYNPAKAPFGGSANLSPGSTPSMTLYVNKPASIALTGTGLIKKVSLKSKVKDGFLLTASFVNKGPWTLPS